MNYYVFYDSTSDATTEEWLKAVEYTSKSVSAVCIGIFVWVMHNICVTHCLHHEGKVLFAVTACLFLPQLSNVIFYIVVGVLQANHADPSVAASWIFFFMLAALASLMFTYLLKPSRIEEWRATLRLVQQVTFMSDYQPRFQKRLASSMSVPPPLVPPSPNVPSSTHSLPVPSVAEQRRRSLADNHRGSVDDTVLDIRGEPVDAIQAARIVAEDAAQKTEALAHDMRMLKASTVFSHQPQQHEEKHGAQVDQLRREIARVEEGVQAQARKIGRLEAQLKESEERQVQAIKTAHTEAQTNVMEMTEQLEKLEAFVVSTSKMVSETVKPKDSSWWSN
jgi:hypothetical protein